MNNYVQQINARNFKGRNFAYPLRPVTLLHGDNSLGKTAVADAIRVLLLGYSPRHGKQPGRTFGFAGSPTGAAEMEVRGIIAGKTIERLWELKKGSVKRGGYDAELVPSVLMDANEWLKLSGPDKTRFIFKLIDLSKAGFSTEKVTARLKTDVKVETPDEASERIIGEVIDAVIDLAEFRDHEGQTHQEWIAAVIEHFKEKQAAAKAVVDDMEGAIGATTTLRAQEGLQTDQNVQAELENWRRALQRSLTDFQTLENQKRDYTAKAARKQAAESAVAKLTDESDLIAKMQNKFEGQIITLREYRSETASIMSKQAAAAGELMAAKKAVDSVASEIANIRAKLKEDLERDTCPYCHSKGKSWKTSIKKTAEKQIAAKEKEMDELIPKQMQSKDNFDAITGRLSASQQKDSEMDTLRNENYNLGRELTAANARQNELKTLRARLEELADIGQPVNETHIHSAEMAVTLNRNEVARLEAIERQQIAAMTDAKRQEQARQAHEAKKIEQQIYKMAVDAMLSLQEEMMNTAFVGFMEKMNLIADGIFPGGKLVFHDGQIGYFAGASFAAMEYFGGTEEMLAFAGLSLTLAQSSPMKIIIMDELGRVSRPRRIALIRRMLQLIRDGVIDQFIGIDVTGEPYGVFQEVEEVALIELK